VRPAHRPTVVWFRRDLRVHDHPALSTSATRGPVIPLVVLDPALLGGRFASRNRIWFLLGAIDALAAALGARGVPLSVRVGPPAKVVPAFARAVGADTVAISREVTPYGRVRDRAVAEALATVGIDLRATCGVLVHEPEEVATGDGRPYAVFTPFLRRWEALALRDVLPAPRRLIGAAAAGDPGLPPGGVAAIPAVRRLGLVAPSARADALPERGEAAARVRLDRWIAASPSGGPTAYAGRRDRLADQEGTSHLGPDLRLGLLSPVEVVARALALDGGTNGSRRFASELAWRDFYAHVLWHDPATARRPFQQRYAGAPWPGGSLGEASPASIAAIDAWRAGRTGYPIVDAAMRQLAATGYLHNRGRMIAASFLTKDLLVDWRVGEAHFMRHLLDGDPASNLGGWQWAASVGTDAQPWFRVFNPVTQGQRFDPDGQFIRRWVPELAGVPTARIHAPWMMSLDEAAAAGVRIGVDYPAPIVDHAEARLRALAWFRAPAPVLPTG
jgi:deoxyribodipyrimidine photo-lyase